MLFPKTSISALEKTGVDLKNQAANFYFNFTWRPGLPNIPVLTFLLAQNEGIFSYLGYEILI